MRPELDFRALRAQIEAATWVPDFSTLYRRAGRVRVRDRMAVVGALVGTLAVFAPVALAGIFGRPTPAALGPNPDLGDPWSPSPVVSAAGQYPSTTTLRAAAGALPDGVVAAVDVCVEVPQNRKCSLQVTVLRDGSPDRRTPFVLDALRQSPLDKLESVELVRIVGNTFMLSGEVVGASRSAVRFSVDAADASPLPGQSGSPMVGPSDRLLLKQGDAAVQLAQYGDFFGVRASDGALSLLANQPPMARRTLIGGLPKAAGWWVAGADLGTGQPAVAVSKDQGRAWLARALDAPVGLDVPTVATLDGNTAFAFVRYPNGIRFFRTADGGDSWLEVRTKIELPAQLTGDKALVGRSFGVLTRPDRSLVMWIQGNSEMVFLESLDGEHFGVVAGPGGPLAAVENGFAALGSPPRVSRDARAWQEATLSATVLPN
ncbi:hypothetical protein KZZ52_04715 [Dactylosporangium sp. AC04546]|uniref:hypothetical protein n=1 Tax=Dactylosporangium sp. AC04546 TaxID=2862460 RepID=UPI001EE11809|nr:hypothetical protein [Dactylosporangium sp. AC04546]WVK84717.1 hypothetical protein KZZ52_04715 [Dactylosporangium sp. AC04546]